MSPRRQDDPNPFTELFVLAEARDAWEDQYEKREADAVIEARKVGLTWEEIADSLGRTRSAVWKKYHQRTDLPD